MLNKHEIIAVVNPFAAPGRVDPFDICAPYMPQDGYIGLRFSNSLVMSIYRTRLQSYEMLANQVSAV